MGENSETDPSLVGTITPSKRFVIEVTKPLSQEEISGLAPQVRSDQTLTRQQACLYAVLKPVELAYKNSNNGSIMPSSNIHVGDFEVPEPSDDITLDSRMEAFFEASRMYHESEAEEPKKDKKDAALERALAKEYEIAARTIHNGVADPAATKILYSHLNDIMLIGASSGADVMYRKKYTYAERVEAMYHKKFPLIEEKPPSTVEKGRAFFTSIAGRFGLKK